jgi:hypothetical protein
MLIPPYLSILKEREGTKNGKDYRIYRIKEKSIYLHSLFRLMQEVESLFYSFSYKNQPRR